MNKSLRRKIVIWAGAIVTALCLAGYATYEWILVGSLAGLRADDSLTLYSIDPTEIAAGKEPEPGELFHRHLVLGKIDIADAAARRQIVSSVKSGVARGNPFVAKACFWPRHGIRAVSGGRTVDLLICFQCDSVAVYRGETVASDPISDSPKPLLNEYLTSAGVPLAPEDD